MSEPTDYVIRKELVNLLAPFGFKPWAVRQMIAEGVIKQNKFSSHTVPKYHWPTVREKLGLNQQKVTR